MGNISVSWDQNLTVVLKLPDRAAFDKAVEFAPTATDFATAKNELVSQGFTVLWKSGDGA